MKLLTVMTSESAFPAYFTSLPILGVDGSLAEIENRLTRLSSASGLDVAPALLLAGDDLDNARRNCAYTLNQLRCGDMLHAH